MISWYLVVLPVVSALTALVELDDVHVGQWMLSRPIVVGPLLGALFGQPGVGLAGGALTELFCVDVLPVGAAMPLNGAVAAAAFVTLAAGPYAVPPALAFPAALLWGSLFRRVETRVRALRCGLARRAEAAMEDGRPAALGRLVARGIGMHAAATAVFLYAGVSVGGPALAWGWETGPSAARRGFELAFEAAPFLGLSALAHALRPKG